AANRSIFYDRSGQPKTVAEVYQGLVARHQGGSAPDFEIAPQPVLADATANAITADDKATGADAAGATQAQSLAVIAGTVGNTVIAMPTRSYTSTAPASTNVPAFTRATLKLSPAVVQVLASMDTSSFASAAPETGRDNDNDRKNGDRRLLPRGGYALG
ncbi:MAG TPA: hypothetical protein VF449_05075, partial [Parvibaculum sp.]